MTFLATLDRKLLREARGMKGQIATIAIVLASGITCFIALRGTFSSLEEARDAYYDHYRFAHVFARVESAPESLARRIEQLPGVALVQTRVVEEVSLPLDDLERAAYGQLISLPSQGEPPRTRSIWRAGGCLLPGVTTRRSCSLRSRAPTICTSARACPWSSTAPSGGCAWWEPQGRPSSCTRSGPARWRTIPGDMRCCGWTAPWSPRRSG